MPRLRPWSTSALATASMVSRKRNESFGDSQPTSRALEVEHETCNTATQMLVTVGYLLVRVPPTNASGGRPEDQSGLHRVPLTSETMALKMTTVLRVDMPTASGVCWLCFHVFLLFVGLARQFESWLPDLGGHLPQGLVQYGP